MLVAVSKGIWPVKHGLQSNATHALHAMQQVIALNAMHALHKI